MKQQLPSSHQPNKSVFGNATSTFGITTQFSSKKKPTILLKPMTFTKEQSSWYHTNNSHFLDCGSVMPCLMSDVPTSTKLEKSSERPSEDAQHKNCSEPTYSSNNSCARSKESDRYTRNSCRSSHNSHGHGLLLLASSYR